ncbi:MAG: methyltransferase domain-containing protein [Euryarchaeota archaeon]|nr:methyltransferase domain-containing protein [Euryarchaeota archaeon]
MDLIPVGNVTGIDKDRDMILAARSRGKEVVLAEATALPFRDDSFDIVYCSFLILWLAEPSAALAEMRRVTRDFVLCLAEPDYGGRVDYPEEIGILTERFTTRLRDDGADPLVGRKLRSHFAEAGMKAEVGVHPGVWDLGRLGRETEDEWKWASPPNGVEGDPELRRARKAWEESLRLGDLFQYSPIFFAVARKHQRTEDQRDEWISRQA